MSLSLQINGRVNPNPDSVSVHPELCLLYTSNADSIGGRGNGRLRSSNFVKYGLYEKGDIRNSNYNIRRVMWYNKPGLDVYKRQMPVCRHCPLPPVQWDDFRLVYRLSLIHISFVG